MYKRQEEALTCQFAGRNGCDRLRSGDQLQLHFPPEALYLFDAEGQALPRLAAPELGA